MISLSNGSMEWLDYLGGRLKSYEGETSLFPLVDELELDEETKHCLRKDRFRWLRSISPDASDWLFEVWGKGSDAILDEPSGFRTSEAFGPCLLRMEVDNIPYYQRLRDCLRIRVRRGQPVLVIGPTSGAEVQAVVDFGAEAYLLADEAPWRVLCNERLHDDRTPFHNLPTSRLTGNCVDSKYAVLSPWLPTPEHWVRLAYEAIGRWGFILFPRKAVRFRDEADRLGMDEMDGYQDEVAVYFKHPALPQTVGD